MLKYSVVLRRATGVLSKIEGGKPFNGGIMSDYTSSLFSSPEEQIRKLEDINRRMWKRDQRITKAIRQLGEPPSNCLAVNTPKRLCVITLVPHFPHADVAMKRGLVALEDVFPGRVHQYKLAAGFLHSRHSFENVLSAPFSLKWRVAEMGRMFRGNARGWDIIEPEAGMGPEFLLLAALHPKWAEAMDGKEVPFLIAPNALTRRIPGAETACVLDRGSQHCGWGDIDSFTLDIVPLGLKIDETYGFGMYF